MADRLDDGTGDESCLAFAVLSTPPSGIVATPSRILAATGEGSG